MARKFNRYGGSTEDMVQAASVGLMLAAEKFDPDNANGARFATYAAWWIRAELQNHVLRDSSMVRIGKTTAQKALFFNLSRVKEKLRREAAERGETLSQDAMSDAVAKDMGVPIKDVLIMEMRLGNSDTSLNQPMIEGDAEFGDLLEDYTPQAAEIFQTAHDHGALKAILGAALGKLKERERRVIIGRKMMDEPRTLDDLAKEIGVSRQRIQQMEVAILGKLRGALKGVKTAHFLM